MNLLFIVGAPRSGTTLLQKKLAESFGFRTLPETHFFSMGLKELEHYLSSPLAELKPQDYQKIQSVLESQELQLPEYQPRNVKALFESMIRNYLPDLEAHQLIIEKTPDHALHIPKILQLYPQAQFVHIIRHPLNVISSMYDLAKRYPEKWNQNHRDLKYIANRWRKLVFRCMGRYNFGRYYQLKYEDFVEQPEAYLQNIVELMDLAKYAEASQGNDQLFELDFEPWKSDTRQKNMLNREDVWRERMTEEEAIWVEEYLQREIGYLGYKRKTQGSLDSGVKKHLRKLTKNWF